MNQADVSALEVVLPPLRNATCRPPFEKPTNAMPRISEFYGIVIFMLYDDHAPPHFHARYAGIQVSVEIATGLVAGRGFPDRALRLVQRWRREHVADLRERWEQASRREPLTPIKPLS
jgi:hypothetical protein